MIRRIIFAIHNIFHFLHNTIWRWWRIAPIIWITLLREPTAHNNRQILHRIPFPMVVPIVFIIYINFAMLYFGANLLHIRICKDPVFIPIIFIKRRELFARRFISRNKAINQCRITIHNIRIDISRMRIRIMRIFCIMMTHKHVCACRTFFIQC